MSLATLAMRVHYSKGHLGNVETGANLPGDDLARRCDAVLKADVRLVAAAARTSADDPAADAPPDTAARCG